jgi:hypothetical protein
MKAASSMVVLTSSDDVNYGAGKILSTGTKSPPAP